MEIPKRGKLAEVFKKVFPGINREPIAPHKGLSLPLKLATATAFVGSACLITDLIANKSVELSPQELQQAISLATDFTSVLYQEVTPQLNQAGFVEPTFQVGVVNQDGQLNIQRFFADDNILFMVQVTDVSGKSGIILRNLSAPFNPSVSLNPPRAVDLVTLYQSQNGADLIGLSEEGEVVFKVPNAWADGKVNKNASIEVMTVDSTGMKDGGFAQLRIENPNSPSAIINTQINPDNPNEVLGQIDQDQGGGRFQKVIPPTPENLPISPISLALPTTPALSGAEGPINTLKPSETPTPTPTEVPKPLGSENLPQNITVVLNEDGSWGIGIGEGNEIQPIPGAFFDSTGLHMTLDSGRTVDIPVSELQKGITYDQESNLFKVYDEQGIISAEYDPGIGQPNSPDYIPSQGWIDIQKLATKLDCIEGETCVTDAHDIPNTVRIEYNSIGIFRVIDAIDTQTNEHRGKLLLLQFVTRNTTDKPVVGWMLIQASDFSRPEVNVFAPVSQGMQLKDGIPLNQTDKNLRSIEQWRSWMPKGSMWTFGFLNDGSFIGATLSKSQLASVDYQDKRAKFLASKGDILLNDVYPFVPNSASSR